MRYQTDPCEYRGYILTVHGHGRYGYGGTARRINGPVTGDRPPDVYQTPQYYKGPGAALACLAAIQAIVDHGMPPALVWTVRDLVRTPGRIIGHVEAPTAGIALRIAGHVWRRYRGHLAIDPVAEERPWDWNRGVRYRASIEGIKTGGNTR